jgi:hypothetical protein
MENYWLIPFLQLNLGLHSTNMTLGTEDVRALYSRIFSYGKARLDLGFNEFERLDEEFLLTFTDWMSKKTGLHGIWIEHFLSLDSSNKSTRTFFRFLRQFLRSHSRYKKIFALSFDCNPSEQYSGVELSLGQRKKAEEPWLLPFLRSQLEPSSNIFFGAEDLNTLECYIHGYSSARRDLGLDKFNAFEAEILPDFARWMWMKTNYHGTWSSQFMYLDRSEKNVRTFFKFFRKFLLVLEKNKGDIWGKSLRQMANLVAQRVHKEDKVYSQCKQFADSMRQNLEFLNVGQGKRNFITIEPPRNHILFSKSVGEIAKRSQGHVAIEVDGIVYDSHRLHGIPSEKFLKDILNFSSKNPEHIPRILVEGF